MNCNDNPDANGTEVIVSPKAFSTSISYAKKVNNSLVKELGTFDRTFGSGYKTSSLIVLNETNCPVILIEPLFVGQASREATFTQTVSNGNLTVTAKPRTGSLSTNYV